MIDWKIGPHLLWNVGRKLLCVASNVKEAANEDEINLFREGSLILAFSAT
jgi:hypothetical protein